MRGVSAAVTIEASEAPPRVLVVDDEPIIRKLVSQVLALHGFAAAVAEDGNQALDTLAREPADYALVLTDVSMPRMDGVTLAQHIRARWPALPVVFMSGLESEDSLGERLPGLPITLFRKPFQLTQLVEGLRRMIGL